LEKVGEVKLTVGEKEDWVRGGTSSAFHAPLEGSGRALSESIDEGTGH